MALTWLPSALPRTWGMMRPMTLPRSPGPAAPVSAMAWRGQRRDFSLAKLFGHILQQDGQRRLFLGHQVGPAALAEHIDALAAVLDLLGHHVGDAGVVQFLEVVLFRQLDLALQKPQGIQPLPVAGAHGTANVLFQPFLDASHRSAAFGVERPGCIALHEPRYE